MILYLGTDPSHFAARGKVLHYPVIKLIPRDIPAHVFDDMSLYTHCIFTSKNTVSILKEKMPLEMLKDKIIIAIGDVTRAKLEEEGLVVSAVAKEETQEGVVEMLKSMSLDQAYIFLPHSALARDVLERFLVEHRVRHQICDLYDTVAQKLDPVPDLEMVETIVFTSPSTVRAFFEIFSFMPPEKKAVCIGPVTQEVFDQKRREAYSQGS